MAASFAVLVLAMACLAGTVTSQNVSGCKTKAITINFSGAVGTKCQSSALCLQCHVIESGPGICAKYKNYLVKCTAKNTANYPTFPIKLQRANLAGILKGAFDKGMEKAGSITMGTEERKVDALPTGLFDRMPMLDQVRVVGSFDTLPKDIFKNNKYLSVLHVEAPIVPSKLPTNILAVPSLKNLYMVGWKMGRYDGSLLQKVTGLRLLYINGGVTSITSKALVAHTQLTDLYIMNNPSLKSLPAGLLDMSKKLRWINISGNAIQKLSSKFFSMNTAAVNIELRKNKLTTLAEDMFSAQSRLSMLNIVGNRLTTLPAKLLVKNTQLVEFWADDNQLKALPANLFRSNTAIRYIYIQKNCIVSAPKNVFQGLPNLLIITVQPQCAGGVTCKSFQLPSGVKCLK